MDKINDCISKIDKIDFQNADQMRDKIDRLAKPVNGLGRLEELGCHLAAIQRTTDIRVNDKMLIVFASDHGVSCEGVSATPRCVTYLQACNTVDGMTAVAALAKVADVNIKVVDVGIDTNQQYSGIVDKKIAHGTKNIAIEPAMSYEQAIQSIEIGMEVTESSINEGANIIVLGELGIANTTPSAAIISLFSKYDTESIVGKGSNISEERQLKKVGVVNNAIKLHQPDYTDPIDVLAKIGGFEIGSKVGAILCAAKNNTPVVIDGFISYSAAILACELCPDARGYIIASHQSAELGSQIAIDYLGLKPYLNLDLCVGEGTGAVLMVNLINSIKSVLDNMATLEQLDIEFTH